MYRKKVYEDRDQFFVKSSYGTAFNKLFLSIAVTVGHIHIRLFYKMKGKKILGHFVIHTDPAMGGRFGWCEPALRMTSVRIYKNNRSFEIEPCSTHGCTRKPKFCISEIFCLPFVLYFSKKVKIFLPTVFSIIRRNL